MRNRGLLWTVIALGLLLAAPELRRLIHNSIRPEDENVAFENLAEVSALQLREQHAVEFRHHAKRCPLATCDTKLG